MAQLTRRLTDERTDGWIMIDRKKDIQMDGYMEVEERMDESTDQRTDVLTDEWTV